MADTDRMRFMITVTGELQGALAVEEGSHERVLEQHAQEIHDALDGYWGCYTVKVLPICLDTSDGNV